METTLSSGIYTIPDAARILGLSLPKVRCWLKGSDVADAVVEEGPARYGINSLGIAGLAAQFDLEEAAVHDALAFEHCLAA